nr:spore germination protein [Paenactinomyces guangxiensis]
MPTVELTSDLTSNLELVKNEIGHNPDVVFRQFKLGFTDLQSAVVFIDGLTDHDLIDKEIIKALTLNVAESYPAKRLPENITDFLKDHVLPISKIKEVHSLKGIVREVLKGSTALFIDGISEVFILGTQSWKSRAVEEPITESLVRGPRLGFNETLVDNISLLRRGLPASELTIVPYEVGRRTKKNLVIAYMDGIANPDLVQEVKSRIERIDIDDVPESGYIEHLIEDNYVSPFPQVQSTERPDRVMSSLLEGQVAILLDGTPFVLIVPLTFFMLLQSPEDYYSRWIPSTLLRFMRFVAAFFSLFLPSLYIAFLSFHQGLIPTKLAISIAGTREGVPFPAFIEALLMEVAIEVLREAGLRLPRPVGQTVGLVGGLVIGEAAVRAGIVSPMKVIVVAITAISSFAIPMYEAGIALRMLRFAGMFCATLLGLYGVILFFLMLSIHFVKLKSFGVPYISPAVPYRLSDWKDFILRIPISKMKRRPKMMHPQDKVRQR